MEKEYHFVRNAIKFIGITLVVYLFLKIILPVVFPFLVAIFIAGSLNPLRKKLERWCQKKWDHEKWGRKNRSDGKQMRENATEKYRTWVCLFLLMAVFVVVGGMIVFFLYILSTQLMGIWNQRGDILGELQQQVEKMGDGLGQKLWNYLKRQLQWEQIGGRVLEKLEESMSILKGVFGGFVNIVVILVGAFLLLKDYDTLHDKVMCSPLGELVLVLGKDLKNVGADYLKAQGIIMGIVILICIAGLYLMGNPYGLLLGILIGICDALPFLGAAVVFVPWALIDILLGKTWQAMVFLLLTAVTTVIRQYLEPKLIGDKIGANPFMVLFSIYVGLQLFGVWKFILGPVGAFLIWEVYLFT